MDKHTEKAILHDRTEIWLLFRFTEQELDPLTSSNINACSIPLNYYIYMFVHYCSPYHSSHPII